MTATTPGTAPARDRPAEVRSAEVRSAEVRSAGAPPAEVRPAGARSVEVRSASPTGAAPDAPAVLWSLNALRAAGALLVMLFHINGWNLQIIRGSGALNGAVGMFFVLSGFVLVWTTRPGTTLRTFATHRLARIVPNHLVTYTLGVVLALLVLDRTVDPWTVLAGAFLLQAWLPSPDMVFAINDVTWSLSCEIAFYVAFPFLLRGLRRLRPGVRVALVGIALLVPPALTLARPALGTLMFHLPPARLPEFVAGMVAAMAVQAGWRPRVPAPVMLGALGVALLGAAAADVIPLPVLTAALAMVFAPLCARCAWADAEGRTRWARHPAVLLAGALSFAFYLLHELVIKVLVQTPLRGWSVVPLVLVASAALAFLLWRGVEIPARARLLRLLDPGPGRHRGGEVRHGRAGRTRWSQPVDERPDPGSADADAAATPAAPPADPDAPAARTTRPVPPPPAVATVPTAPTAPTVLPVRAALPPAPAHPRLPATPLPASVAASAAAWGVATASMVAGARRHTHAHAVTTPPTPAPGSAVPPPPAARPRHDLGRATPGGRAQDRRPTGWTAPLPPPTPPAPAGSATTGPDRAWRPPAPPSPRA